MRDTAIQWVKQGGNPDDTVALKAHLKAQGITSNNSVAHVIGSINAFMAKDPDGQAKALLELVDKGEPVRPKHLRRLAEEKGWSLRELRQRYRVLKPYLVLREAKAADGGMASSVLPSTPPPDRAVTPSHAAEDYIDVGHPPLISLESERPDSPSPVPGSSMPTPTGQQAKPASDEGDKGLWRPWGGHSEPIDLDAQQDVDMPVQVKLERPSTPDSASPRNEATEALDVTDMEVGDSRPWVKTEPEAPESSPPPIATADQPPIAADAPVKDELPVVRHEIDNTVPILQDQDGRDIVLKALQPPQKSRQTDDLAELLARQKLTFSDNTKLLINESASQGGSGKLLQERRKLKEAISRKAQELALMSGDERAAYLDHWMAVEEVPGKGRGVKAVRDIPPFTVLAPYAGKLLSGDSAMRDEAQKLGINFSSYLFGTKNPNEVVSAFGNGVGNISSMVNQGDDPAENNLTVFMLGGKLIYLMNEKPIKAGEELLYDYGSAYDYRGWPDRPIPVEESDSADESDTGPD